ncbi:MAG: hypothetical protein ACTSU2_03830 [Promethearchaeota archaeon]
MTSTSFPKQIKKSQEWMIFIPRPTIKRFLGFPGSPSIATGVLSNISSIACFIDIRRN